MCSSAFQTEDFVFVLIYAAFVDPPKLEMLLAVSSSLPRTRSAHAASLLLATVAAAICWAGASVDARVRDSTPPPPFPPQILTLPILLRRLGNQSCTREPLHDLHGEHPSRVRNVININS